MNAAGIKAIETALGQARDNLYRAEHQKKNLPNWKDGNGVNIDVIIRGYQKQVRELSEALAEADRPKPLLKDIQTCERD